MRVLYFGTYERDYPRNAQVISCLRGAGVEVVERHVSVWEGKEHKFSPGLGSAARLARAELELRRRRPTEFDLLVVGYPGHLDIRAARRAAGHRPVVFNPLVSLEDTIVGDRALVTASSLRSRLLRAIDRRAFRGADLVVADTEAHADYFRAQFGLPSNRVAVCLVGAEDSLFTPGPASREPFSVVFVGKLIPLHGLETIVAAAALVPDVPFRIVGTGQLDATLASPPANVRHEPWVAYRRLPELYRSAGCALGIFGTSDKAARVIPNKAFQALATATPVITSDTAAQRELLENGRDALLVPAGSADALAAAVNRLASDPALAARIGAHGRETYLERASEKALGTRWSALLQRML